ncbi:MAG: EAL domain-containing protein [Undibacterium umbellatum]|uniref:sensor domain-containing phosphodiesterase n=1 Tax=Undibacterium umbellatum TaxID=2762300 RepID=UPI003BB80129
MTSYNSLSIYSRSFWLTLFVFAVFAASFFLYVESEKEIDRANELRFNSHSLMEELRQSSDDLTRMVRSYVATGDTVYKKNYYHILAVRNGQSPRPAIGKPLYWDLMPTQIVDKTPSVGVMQDTAAGKNISFFDLLRQAGYSEREYKVLLQAKQSSDNLALIELDVMRQLETTGPHFEEIRDRLIRQLHGKEYIDAKTSIMSLIHAAHDLMDERTLHLVKEADANSTRLRIVFILFGVLLLGLLWRAYRALHYTLGATVSEVHASLVKLGSGDFNQAITFNKGMSESIMAWLSVTQSRLAQIEGQRLIETEKNLRIGRLYNALSQCNQSILRITNEDDLLPGICTDAVDIAGLKMAWVGIFDASTNVLRPRAAYGAGIEYLQNLVIDLAPGEEGGLGPSALAFINRRPEWCQQFQSDPRTEKWHERGRQYGWKSSAALPLFMNKEVIGTLNVYSENENAFDDVVKDLLIEFSVNVSHVLNRFRLEREQRHALLMEELRSYLLERITFPQRMDELLTEVVLKIEALLPGCICSILLLGNEGRYIRTGAAPNLPAFYVDAINGLEIGPGLGSCGNAMFTGQRTIAQDLSTHPFWVQFWPLANQAGLRACWSQPIFSSGRKVIGAFAIYHQAPSEPDTFALNLLEMAAHLIAIGIERKQSEDSLRKLSLAVEQSSNAIVITDNHVNIEYANACYLKNAGKELADVLGHNPSIMHSGKTAPEVYEEMWRQLQRGESWKGELINLYADGQEHTDLAHISPIRNAAGVVTHFLAIQEDITDKKRTEERIKYLAHYDSLTGLPNRALLDELARYALSLAERSHDPLAVIFFDLDHFKDINDTLGHSVGDIMLVELSKRLVAAMRENDTIARLGGDEFILLLTGVDEHKVEQVVQKLMRVVNAPFHIGEYDLNVTASMGIAIYPNDGLDLETLSRNADAAMYRAKREGRNGYCFFTQEMQERSTRHLDLINALRQAVDLNQFQLHYQPQLSIDSGKVLGAEALLRWHHPVLGHVSPAEFIPVAEESGLILPIGEWVLRTAAHQWKQWKAMGLPDLMVAVNLSAVQFRHLDLPDLVTRILQEAEMPAACLELELTEGVAMHDPQGAIAVMNDLHARGIRMSIDDFGTGYSSLSYLKKFKVYKLKIDQSFVRDINSDPEDRAIVSAVISMAKSLGLMTIAEGVETAEQLEFLREHHCDEVQGYYYSRPLPASQFADFVRNSLCVN